MINVNGFQFYEDEKIKMDDILRCHPQLDDPDKEVLGVPLRVTIGYQCIYEKIHRAFQGLTFYVPVKYSKLKSEFKAEGNGKTWDNLSYVLASYDGTLVPYKDGVCLVSGGRTLVYNNMEILKSTGSVKKGAIIGKVKLVEHGYGYGVTLRGYQGGEVWVIPDDLYNIPCIE